VANGVLRPLFPGSRFAIRSRRPRGLPGTVSPFSSFHRN
jgi:hypothetical protein